VHVRKIANHRIQRLFS